MELQLKIYGKVQGIGFRSFVYRVATALSLTGYVQNDKEETVTVFAQGPKEALRKLLAYCKKGSPFATVEKVDVVWKEKDGVRYDAFQIRR